MTDKFKFIRDADKPNLDALLAGFTDAGIRAELRGSAAERSDYQDIDFYVDRIAEVPSVIGKLDVKDLDVIQLPAGFGYVGTYVSDRYQFELKGTKFDLSGNRLDVHYPTRQLVQFFLPPAPLGGGSSGSPGTGNP